MKTISAVFAVITMFSASAMATSNHNGPSKGGDSNATSISGAVSKAEARSASASKSSSKSKSSATGGNAVAAGGSGGSAVASIAPMSFSFTAPATPSASFVQHDYSGMPNNTPAMGNTYVNSSNGCDGAVGASLVLPGFGGSLSASTLRMMCEGRLNAQAHNALGDQEKAKKVLRVVDEYACSQDAAWAKIAREEGLCKPEEKTASNAQPASSWLGSN